MVFSKEADEEIERLKAIIMNLCGELYEENTSSTQRLVAKQALEAMNFRCFVGEKDRIDEIADSILERVMGCVLHDDASTFFDDVQAFAAIKCVLKGAVPQDGELERLREYVRPLWKTRDGVPFYINQKVWYVSEIDNKVVGPCEVCQMDSGGVHLSRSMVCFWRLSDRIYSVEEKAREASERLIHDSSIQKES